MRAYLQLDLLTRALSGPQFLSFGRTDRVVVLPELRSSERLSSGDSGSFGRELGDALYRHSVLKLLHIKIEVSVVQSTLLGRIGEDLEAGPLVTSPSSRTAAIGMLVLL